MSFEAAHDTALCPASADGQLLVLESTSQLWQELLLVAPQASPFHQPAWGAVLAASYGYRTFCIGLERDGKLVAGLPLMEINSRITEKRWVSLPFTDHCSPLYTGADVLACLSTRLLELAQDRQIPRLEIRWPLQLPQWTCLPDEHVLSVLTLHKNPDLLAAGMKRKHFRQIEVAAKRGVRVEFHSHGTQALRQFYRLHVATRRRLGVPVQPWRFFELVDELILAAGAGFILLAYQGAACVAGALFLHGDQTLVYKYSATSDAGRQLLAMDPVLWYAICWGCEHDYTRLDMGRTVQNNNGLRMFKRRWGAEETPLAYSVFPAHEAKLRPSRLQGLPQQIIRNTPSWVCRLAGELLYRHFG